MVSKGGGWVGNVSTERDGGRSRGLGWKINEATETGQWRKGKKEEWVFLGQGAHTNILRGFPGLEWAFGGSLPVINNNN